MSLYRRFNCRMGWHRWNGVWDKSNRYTKCRDCRGWFRLYLTGVVPRAKDLEAELRKQEQAEEAGEVVDFVRARASEAASTSPDWGRAQTQIMRMLEETVYEERAARILAEQHRGHPDHKGEGWAP